MPKRSMTVEQFADEYKPGGYATDEARTRVVLAIKSAIAGDKEDHSEGVAEDGSKLYSVEYLTDAALAAVFARLRSLHSAS